MSFSGGVYTLPGPALVTGEVVSATENNQFRNDVATAFNLTMLRNGTSTATANLPMGGYKLTGLGAPTTNGDALSYGKAAVVTSLTSTALTATRVPYAGTGGLLQDASTFTFDGTTLTAGGFSGPHNGTVGATTPNTGAFTTLSASSTVSGTGFSNYLASPPAIGGTVAAAGSFTTLSASSTVSGAGFSTYLASPPAIGGTAAAAGSFTTLTTSSTVTVNGGTANGVAYLNGSKVLTTGSALQFDGSNLGLGVTPSAWASGYKAIEIGSLGSSVTVNTASGNTLYSANAYVGASGSYYGVNNYAVRYFQRATNGQHEWYTAPSGTAGNAITFTQAMTLDASGNLGVGRTSPVNFGANWTGLEVAGKNTSSGGIIRVSTSDASVQADLYVDSLAVLRTATNHPLVFATNASERMRIDSSGNVGIGTSSPGTYGKLEVLGAGYTAVNVRSSDASGVNVVLASNSSNEARLNVLSNHPLAFYTNASERMRIDSSGNLLFNSGYGSVATAYGCRAWVNFNGTGTVTIRASGNVSSITDNGTGNYTVNFTTAMPDVNYSRCVTVGGNTTSTASNVQSPYNSTPTTTTLSVSTFNTAWSALQDCNDVNVAIFR